MEDSDTNVIDFYTRKEHLQEKEYRLKTFASLIGLRFIESFGVAEISMGSPEIKRLLKLVADVEKEKSQPNALILESIDTVLEHVAENVDYSVIAEAVIGLGHIDITPDHNK